MELHFEQVSYTKKDLNLFASRLHGLLDDRR